MPFKNSYKGSFYDRTTCRWWIVYGLFFAVFLVFLILQDPKFEEQAPPIADRSARRAQTPATESERMKRVDELCGSLPKPEEFYFAQKMALTETDYSVSIIHTFKSSRSKEEIYPTFIVWFDANGWADDKTPYDQLEFSKDQQTVTIAPFSTKEGDYFGINCTEWKTE